MVTHVLDERQSPTEALIWTMWCGAQFVVWDDGTSAPEGMDFYGEAEAEKADCLPCRLQRRQHKTVELGARLGMKIVQVETTRLTRHCVCRAGAPPRAGGRPR